MSSSPAAADQLAWFVAACCRLLHAEGILNYSGHVSARLHDGEGFLIYYVQRGEASGVLHGMGAPDYARL